MDFSKQDCIDEIIRVANLDPDVSLSRNYFRANANIPESAWQKWFGNFIDFKRAANLEDSRHARQIISQIAKHSSVDHLEQAMVDLEPWATRYLRPTGKTIETILVGSDIHDIHCDPFWRRLFIDTARRVEPEKIVINGDLFDLPEFSNHVIDPKDYNLADGVDRDPTASDTIIERDCSI